MAKEAVEHKRVRCGCGLEDLVIITTITPMDGDAYSQVVTPPGWRLETVGGSLRFHCPDCQERGKSCP